MLCKAARSIVPELLTPWAARLKVRTPSEVSPEKNPVRSDDSFEIINEKYDCVRSATVRTMPGLSLANSVLTPGKGKTGISN